MHDAHEFLNNLALVLCVAAVTTVVFQRLRQPVVLGYIVAGLLIGPNLSVALVADPDLVQTLSELGVILVMFSLGLEFSLRRLLKKGIAVALVAVIEVSSMMWLGFIVGRLFGWTTVESMLAAAAVAISSTTVIAKAFEEEKVRGSVRELVYGVLIFEDLIAIVLLATLPSVLSAEGASLGGVLSTLGKLSIFLLVFLVAGMLVVPRLMRYVVRLGKAETTLVASVGFCFAVAVLVSAFDYSVALGAFLAGSLVAESGAGPRVEALVKPIRDMFAAIFFVSVGMLIDMSLVLDNWAAVVVLSLLVVVGKIVAVSFAAFLSGNTLPVAIRSGLSMAQIGEFSFIIVAAGLALGSAGSFLFPVVVAVSVLTTLLTPKLVRVADRVASSIQARLPAPIQTVTALYCTWIDGIAAGGRGPVTRASRIRRRSIFLVVDVFFLALIVVTASLVHDPVQERLAHVAHVGPYLSRYAVVVLAGLLALPFAIGTIRQVRGLGLALAELALPSAAQGELDLAAAPRRALVVTLQMAVLLFVGFPVVVVTQPFLPVVEGATVLVLVFVLFGIGFWRSATNLQGHVRAGAQVIVEVLAAQGSPVGTEGHHGDENGVDGTGERSVETENLAAVERALPGLGAPCPVRIAPGSPAVGRTLAELDLRGLTGATVLAITRGGGDAVIVPTGKEQLEAEDVLAVAGAREAVEAARAILQRAAPDSPQTDDLGRDSGVMGREGDS